MEYFTIFIIQCLFQFLLTDAAPIKTNRTISCHFENGFCGWTPDTMGHIKWERNTGNSKDRSSGISQDHTFKDSNTMYGYYVYTPGWNDKTSATLLSDVITLSAPTNFTFWYQMNGNGEKNLSLSLMTNGTEIEIWIEGSRSILWRFASVSLDSNTITNIISKDFQLKFTSSTSSATGSDIALDDLRLLSEPEPPLQGFTDMVSSVQSTVSMVPQTNPSSNHLLPGSCTFDSDLCGYTPLSGQSAAWFQISTTAKNQYIPPSIDGHYVYFKTNDINVKNGDTGSLVSPKLNIDGCIDLEFIYILPYTGTMTLSIKLLEEGKITLVKNITGIKMNNWTTTINNICVTKNTQLIFETVKLSYYAYVGIDNIKVTMSKLTKPSTTTPSPKPATTKITSKPATAKPATPEPAATKATPMPSTTKLTSKQATAKPATQKPAATKATIMPATTKLTSKPATIKTTPKPVTTKQTTQLETTKQTLKPRTTKRTTMPATKSPTSQPPTKPATTKPQTTKEPSTESPTVPPTVASSIQCGFDKDVCGFNLTSNPDSLPWLIGDRSGPTTDFSSTKQGRYLFFSFSTTIPSNKDPLARMTSGPVDGHIYKCLLLRYKTSSNRSDIFNIYINGNSNTAHSTWTLSQQAINQWDPIQITLPDDNNLQLLFEGLVKMDTKGYLAIDDWHLAQEPCKEKPRCLGNPCKNNGICKESLKSYVCVCSGEFSGTNCETALTTSRKLVSQITAQTLVTAQFLSASPMSSQPLTAATGTETNNPGSTQQQQITLGTAIPQSTQKSPTSNLPVTAHTSSASSMSSQLPLVSLGPAATGTETQNPGSTKQLVTAKPLTTEKLPTNLPVTAQTLVTAEQIPTTEAPAVNETATESYGAALTKGETYALIAGGSLAVVVILSCLIARCYKNNNFKGGDIYDDTYGKEINGLPVSTDVKNPKDSELTVLNYTRHQHL